MEEDREWKMKREKEEKERRISALRISSPFSQVNKATQCKFTSLVAPCRRKTDSRRNFHCARCSKRGREHLFPVRLNTRPHLATK
jgi:hypothetical protein